MHSSIKITALVASAALSLAGLSACSSSSSSNEASAAPSGSMVGGMTTCDEATLEPIVQEAAKAMGADNVFTTDGVQCADGWALVTGILGTGSTDPNAPEGAPTTFIFEAEGQFWIPKTAADVCGTIDGTAYPADAQIPEALYTAGCLAG